MTWLLAHLSGWQARLIEAALTWTVGVALVGVIVYAFDTAWSWWAVPAAAAVGALLEAGKYLAGLTTLSTLEDR